MKNTIEHFRGFKMNAFPRKVLVPKPPKPADKIQNAQTAKPAGKTRWINAHWHFNYVSREYSWVLGQWA